jgi:predicted dehydrogenase
MEKMPDLNRREFIRTTGMAGMAAMMLPYAGMAAGSRVAPGKRIGIIGLDTSHSQAFTKLLNSPDADPAFGGYKVVAAYPPGSKDIAFSVGRIPQITKDVAAMGVEITTSIAALLSKSDVVLLNTNDGRLHYEQALEVMKAGKRMYINKPLAGSLKDILAIFADSHTYRAPVFSSSAMRYFENIKDISADKTGKILGADAYSPATIEKTHPDLFWYGIHGVEMLYTLMSTGCTQVIRVSEADTDLVVGTWEDKRIGTFRGTRSGTHDYGATLFTEKAVVKMQEAKGYHGLVQAITQFFDTGISPVSQAETTEIYTFMAAADESKRLNGAPVKLATVLAAAMKQ